MSPAAGAGGGDAVAPDYHRGRPAGGKRATLKGLRARDRPPGVAPLRLVERSETEARGNRWEDSVAPKG